MGTQSGTIFRHHIVNSHSLLLWLLTITFMVIISTTRAIQAEVNPSKSLDYTQYNDPALLSIGDIKKIIEDRQGYIWIAGAQGLLRYDGYTFKTYPQHDHDNGSISTNSVNDILASDDGYLWVATYWKLNRFDPATGKFEHFGHDPGNPRSLSHNSIKSVAEGANGVIWVGTVGSGLNRFNPKSQDFDLFTHQTNDSSSISNNSINNLLEDSRGQLWISFPGNGLDLFDPQEGKVIQRFRHRGSNDLNSNAPNSNDPNNSDGKYNGNKPLTHNNVSAITESPDGYIWVATDGNGYNRINPITREVTLYPKLETQEPGIFPYLSSTNIYAIVADKNGDILFGSDSNAPLSIYRHATNDVARYRLPGLPSVSVNNLFRDRSGGLWVGLLPRGLIRINRYSKALEIYQKKPRTNEALSDSSVLSIAEDFQGNLLVGTRKGLNRINRKSGKIHTYKQRDENLNVTNSESLSAHAISAILLDGYNQALVGNTFRGLDRLDLDTGKVLHSYIYDVGDSNGLGNQQVWSLFKDRLGTIWVGGNNGMLHRYRPKTDDFVRTQLRAPHKQSSARVIVFHEDLNGDMWIGSDDGLYYAKREHNSAEQLGLSIQYFGGAFASNTPLKLDRHAVHAITEDKHGNMWIGTEGTGVHFWNRKTNKYKTYRRDSGLKHDNIYGIMQDEQGNMWFSTGNGIASLNLQTHKFSHYNQDHGLKGTNFNQSVYYKTRYGELAFGNDDGLVLIQPEKIYHNTYAGPTVISDFLVFNQSVTLDQPLSHLENITLDYTQSMFSFRISALNYDLPSQNQYSYKLEGLDVDWNNVGTLRNATYTNIDPGHYVFKVKSANNEGVWNSAPRAISLTILPPWWRTWWAWTLYCLSFLSLLGLIFYSFLQKNRAKDKEQLNLKLLELDRIKDTFLANTSHELRTPLNGIIGLSQALIDGVGGQQSLVTMENLRLIVGSGQRLSYLINDILDYSKLKDSAITLHRTAIDLAALVDGIILLSQPLLEGKRVTLSHKIDKSMPPIMADQNRLLQILHNIIGNAVKFTQQGHITITTETTHNAIWVSVSDTGTGIAPENINSMFDAFQQEDASHSNTAGGTGLGLTVTKQLVELHDGEIEINSTLGKGTTVRFSLSIPQQGNTPSLTEIRTSPSLEVNTCTGTDTEISSRTNITPNTHYHILIVDDEPVNRRVLLNLLPMASYRVTPCSSGSQALELLEGSDHDIDLILLDVMMPGMNGYEVCRTLRLRYSVSELPILFLTAKSQLSDLQGAYSAGGNDYLTKPVAKEEIFARIETQLKLLERNRCIEKEVALRTDQVTQAYEQLKQAQRQLVRSEKMSSLGTLVAGIGHEINNPVNFINNAMHLIDRDLIKFKSLLQDLVGEDSNNVMPLFEEHFNALSRHLETLGEGSNRVTKIVNNLHAFSRGSEGSETSTTLPFAHLGEHLTSTLDLVKTNYKSDITFSCDIQDDPELPCNSSELNQVFMNLMVNACQAMAGRKQASLAITMQKINSELCIAFKDTGCGMPQSTINCIFDPFFTTKPEGEGTGLGMAISYGVIERHKGRFEIKSEVGEGTEIMVYLALTE